MRLEPIDRAPTLLGRLMSWAMRRQLGAVIMPARVLYNRVPRMWNLAWAQIRLEMQGMELDHELALLIQARVALLNGCAFCNDIATARAVQEKLGLEKFQALDAWRDSPLFDDRERAALAYAEEVTRHKEVGDEVFEELRKHFDDRAIVEITYVNALENYYNLMNVPLRIPDDGLLARARGAA